MITETHYENNSDCTSLFDKKTICEEEDKYVYRQSYEINEDNTHCASLYSKLKCDNIEECNNPINVNLICYTENHNYICKENYIINSIDSQCLEILYKVTCYSNNDYTIFDGNSKCNTKKNK